MKILLVDDDEAFRRVLADMLAKEGYIIATASDGDEAKEILLDAPFDIVLLDLMMPKVSGMEVLKFIQDVNHPAKVIMLTAYGDLKLAVEAKKLGAADFIAKPVMRADLLQTIQNISKGIPPKRRDKA